LSRYKDIPDVSKKLDMTLITNNEWIMLGRLNNPLPRAFLVHGVTEKTLDDFNVNLDPVYENGKIKTSKAIFPITPVEITNFEPESVSLAIENNQESYLVLSDLFHPFWKARLDGRDVAISQAFYLYRAVKVPAGSHTSNFYCSVPYFEASFWISAVVILFGILSFFVLRRKWLTGN